MEGKQPAPLVCALKPHWCTLWRPASDAVNLYSRLHNNDTLHTHFVCHSNESLCHPFSHNNKWEQLYPETAVSLSALKPVLLLRLNTKPSGFYKATHLLPSELSQIDITLFNWMSRQQSESVILKELPVLCAIANQKISSQHNKVFLSAVLLPEKDLQVPQGPEQPESLGCGAEGNQSAGGHGFDFATPGRVHPSGPSEHHLHTAGWGRKGAVCKHCCDASVSPWEWFALLQLCCEGTKSYFVRNYFVFLCILWHLRSYFKRFKYMWDTVYCVYNLKLFI